MASGFAFAENLKWFRTQKNIRQYDLADALHISPQAVSKWEKGLAVPEVETICQIADLFGVSVDRLLQNDTQARRMIAVDGGGTKTEFVLFREDGALIRHLSLEGCNPNVCGMERTIQILRLGLESLGIRDQDIAGVFCGIAGILSRENGERVQSLLETEFPGVPIRCRSDIFNVAALARNREACITAICGTGVSVCNVRGEELRQAGGWGYLFDPYGSGYTIGRDAVSACLAQFQGTGPETMLTPMLEQRLGGDAWNQLGKIYDGGVALIASYAALVFEAAKAGDGVSLRILEQNGKGLARKINEAAAFPGGVREVVISGGLMRHREIFLELIARELAPGLEVYAPEANQICGAAVQCLRLCGAEEQGFQEKFMESYRNLTEKRG